MLLSSFEIARHLTEPQFELTFPKIVHSVFILFTPKFQSRFQYLHRLFITTAKIVIELETIIARIVSKFDDFDLMNAA